MKDKGFESILRILFIISVLLITITIIVLTIAGCNTQEVEASSFYGNKIEFETVYDGLLDGKTVYIMTDTEAGVQYLVIYSDGACSIVPRLDSKGDFLYLR